MFFPSCPVSHCMKKQQKADTRASTLTLDFPASRTLRNKCLVLGGFVLAAEWIKTIICVPSTLRENTIQTLYFGGRAWSSFAGDRPQGHRDLPISALNACTTAPRQPQYCLALIRAFFFPQPCDPVGMSSLHFLFFLVFFFSLFFVRKGLLFTSD